MSIELEEGDRVKVRVGEGWGDFYDGREGVLTDVFCDYGDHRVGVMFDGADRVVELMEYMFEHVVDPYEYGVQRSSTVKSNIIGDHWADKEEQVAYLESLTQVLPKGVEYKMVKRRKAGRIEDV